MPARSLASLSDGFMPYYSLANLILIAALHVGVAQPLSLTVITAQCAVELSVMTISNLELVSIDFSIFLSFSPQRIQLAAECKRKRN